MPPDSTPPQGHRQDEYRRALRISHSRAGATCPNRRVAGDQFLATGSLSNKPRKRPRTPDVDPDDWHFYFEPPGSCPQLDVEHQSGIAAILANGRRNSHIGRSDR